MKRLIFLPLLLISAAAFACTSAIISGSATPDGRPLMWKHRDTGTSTLDNRIEQIKGEKFTFIALVNSHNLNSDEAWAGCNEAGFSIMNTASYNLKVSLDNTSVEDMEGVLMSKALSVCSCLEDFEALLDSLPRPLGVEANFGVIDSYGGAAYYEVNNQQWTKIDVNDRRIAPNGYLVVTNFSYTGRMDQGSGYVRYHTAVELFNRNKLMGGVFTPQWIFQQCSRSFYNSLLGIDLMKDSSLTPNGWFVDSDFIPRRTSAASVVFQGVGQEENPTLTTMWTILGYPPTGVAVPLFPTEQLPAYMVKYGDNRHQSSIVEVNNPFHSEMCELSLNLKSDIFGVSRGNGNEYFRFGKLYNGKGDGYMQRMVSLENDMFNLFDDSIEIWRMRGKIDSVTLQRLYSSFYEMLGSAFASIR